MSDDDVLDRYEGRFADEESEQSEEREGNEKSSEDSMNEQMVESEQSDGKEESAWNVQNVKQDWKGWTVYLPPEFLDDVQDESKLLDVRLDREVKMDRHFKPLLIALGMERLEGMEENEVSEFLERMERGDLKE